MYQEGHTTSNNKGKRTELAEKFKYLREITKQQETFEGEI
jgi:hypothetical protein